MRHPLAVLILVAGIFLLPLIVHVEDVRGGTNPGINEQHMADALAVGTQPAHGSAGHSFSASTRADSVTSDAGGASFHARPRPDCSVFFLTNAGGYLKLNPHSSTPPSGVQSNLRAIWDWGVMVNISPRDAIGGSWFVTWDEDDVATGPVVRYRRWFEQGRSLDVAVGTPVAGGDGLQTGSILGLVKFNPVHWFGVALRPEYVRYATSYYATSSSGRIYAGVELGWYPGLALSVVGGVAAAAFLALAAGLE
jgi:hypothetical protein